MSQHQPLKHGTIAANRRIDAPRELVYEAWTGLEHRRQWFAGPAWTEIERSLDLKVAGDHFSVSLAGVEFDDAPGGTELTYTEHAFFLVGEFDAEERSQGSAGLLDQFTAHVATLTST